MMVLVHSYTHMCHSQPTCGALIMRNDADYQIMFKQFPVRVLSLSTPRFQHPQKASNYASNGVCLLSRLPGTVEITKKASTSFVEFNIEFKGNSRRGALRRLSLLRVLPNRAPCVEFNSSADEGPRHEKSRRLCAHGDLEAAC